MSKKALKAFIQPELCIGCTRCRAKCPARAIIGIRRCQHFILPQLCTGCNQCVKACPTAAITLVGTENE